MQTEVLKNLVYDFKFVRCKGKSLVRLVYINANLFRVKEPKRNVCSLLFFVYSKTLSCFFSLFFKRSDTVFKLGKNILYSIEVILNGLELAFRFFFSVSIFSSRWAERRIYFPFSRPKRV